MIAEGLMVLSVETIQEGRIPTGVIWLETYISSDSHLFDSLGLLPTSIFYSSL